MEFWSYNDLQLEEQSLEQDSVQFHTSGIFSTLSCVSTCGCVDVLLHMDQKLLLGNRGEIDAAEKYWGTGRPLKASESFE